MSTRKPYVNIDHENLAKAARQYRETMLVVAKNVNALQRAMQPRMAEIAKNMAKLQRDMQPVAEAFRRFAVHTRRTNLVEKAGWLPHETSPLEDISIEMEVDDVDSFLSRHYADNWHDVSTADVAPIFYPA